jgi:predicted GNAT superfamily acetyltransferase
MNLSDDVKIQVATSEYLPQVIELAKSYQLEQIQPELLEKYGFFVSGFEGNDYQNFLERANFFYVYVEKENVLGFILAYSSNYIQEAESLNLQIKSQYPEPFVVIKQICVRQDAIGRGIANFLYQHLFDRILELPLFAAIVLNPMNVSSIDFHERLGFRRVFNITPSDGIPRGVWQKKAISLKVLTNQYNIAISLYNHEDDLNWKKLNHLLYVSAALGMVILLIIQGIISPLQPYIPIFIGSLSLVGLIVSISFEVIINSGINYLHTRKNTVIEIERRLIQYGGIKVVLPEGTSVQKKLLKMSPTTRLLKLLPILPLIFWGVLLVVSINSMFNL